MVSTGSLIKINTHCRSVRSKDFDMALWACTSRSEIEALATLFYSCATSAESYDRTPNALIKVTDKISLVASDPYIELASFPNRVRGGAGTADICVICVGRHLHGAKHRHFGAAML